MSILTAGLPNPVWHQILNLLPPADHQSLFLSCQSARTIVGFFTLELSLTQDDMPHNISPFKSLPPAFPSLQLFKLDLTGPGQPHTLPFLEAFTQHYRSTISQVSSLHLKLPHTIPPSLAVLLHSLLTICTSLTHISLKLTIGGTTCNDCNYSTLFTLLPSSPEHPLSPQLLPTLFSPPTNLQPAPRFAPLDALDAPSPSTSSDPAPPDAPSGPNPPQTPTNPNLHQGDSPQNLLTSLWQSPAFPPYLHAISWKRHRSYSQATFDTFTHALLTALPTLTALRNLRIHDDPITLPVAPLTTLTRLHLESCALGSYDEEWRRMLPAIAALTALQDLCACTGAEPARDASRAVPASWSNLQCLTKLVVVGAWVGEESGIRHLSSLQHLELSGCVLPPDSSPAPGSSGPSPCLWNLAHLRHLSLSTPTVASSSQNRQVHEMTTPPQGIWALQHLTTLELNYTHAASVPAALSVLTSLQRLSLSSSIFLAQLPSTIGQLFHLQHLDLQSCIFLSGLPETLSLLTSLTELNLAACSSLPSLPPGIGCLSQLNTLKLRKCVQLRNLPEGLWVLTGLRNLDLGECSRLRNISGRVGNLANLEELLLDCCSSVRTLPDELCTLSSLKKLQLSRCLSLQHLPGDLGHLTALTCLSLDGCKLLPSLPDSISRLTCLRPGFRYTSDYRRQIELEEMQELRKLQCLQLEGCGELLCLPDSIAALTQLQGLCLQGCTSLVALPDTLGRLSNIQHLDASNCLWLESLPESIGQLDQLKSLWLKDCRVLSALPDTLERLTGLTSLNLQQCTGLVQLPAGFGGLVMLRKLDLCLCTSLASLPESFGNLGSLRSLDLRECRQLRQLPGSFRNLVELKELNLYRCPARTALPPALKASHSTPVFQDPMEGYFYEMQQAMLRR